MMDKTDFDIHFDLAFATRDQSVFEGWFANMAAAVFGLDFELIKAGGKNGDKKSDGRHVPTETIYQCYAPESPSTFASKSKTKIRDSFPEVTTYWPNIKEWVFVHNNAEGLPPSASDEIEKLRKEYPKIKITAPSPPRRFLKDEFHDKLNLQQLIDIYPSASHNFRAVTMEHIRPLLKQVISSKSIEHKHLDFGNIPNEDKLDFNSLTPDAKYNIKRARPHVDIVDRYFLGLNNPKQASLLQFEIRQKYNELKQLGYDSDEITGKMLEFFGASGAPTVNSAAYVILAYYFDACDIFENLPNGSTC